MINGESIGTLYVDIKANDKITPDFSKFMRDVENTAVLTERKLSQKIMDFIASRKKSYLDNLFYLNDVISDYGYKKIIYYLDIFIDDVQEKADRLANRLEKIDPKVDITADNNLFDLLKYQKQLKAEQENLAKDYYNRLKFEDDNYFTWKVQHINKEADLFKKRLADKFDTAKFISNEMKTLTEEFEKFQTGKNKSGKSIPQNDNWTVPTSASNPDGSAIWDAHNINTNTNPFMPNSEGLLKTVQEPSKPPLPSWNTEQFFKDFIESSRSGQVAFETFSAAVAQSLDFIHIRLASDASSMEIIWGNMINTMIDQISMLVAKWAVLNFVGAVFGFGGINLGSFLGLSDPSSGKGGKNLGSFIGMKLASGGDFIVPPGFPNDSYPMLVQSGERVKVTPSGKVGDEIIILNQIKDAIHAQSLNQLNIQSKSPNINIQIDGRTLFKTVDRVGEKSRKEGWKNK